MLHRKFKMKRGFRRTSFHTNPFTKKTLQKWIRWAKNNNNLEWLKDRRVIWWAKEFNISLKG